jgi:hypothetical protein
VSPLFTDRVEIFLGPRSVQLVRRLRGLRPKEGLNVSLECVSGRDSAWQPAIETLERGLATLAWQHADVAVTLSNHFVRYALVPSIAGAKHAERDAIARHELSTLYGDEAGLWRLTVGDAPRNASAVAGAVDPVLMEELVACLRVAGLTPRTVEPFLAPAFNACRAAMNGEDAWLAVAEPGRTCVAHLSRGRWLALRSHRSKGALREDLPLALEQTRLAAGAAPGPVYFVSRDEAPFEFAAGSHWSLRPVALSA